MKKFMVDCNGIKNESELWQRYVAASSPQGAAKFGYNLAAFRDAILAGGPGWPGESELHFCNTTQLKEIDSGKLYSELKAISVASDVVRIHLA